MALSLFEVMREAILPIELLWENGHDWASAPLIRQCLEVLIEMRLVRYRKAPDRVAPSGGRGPREWVKDEQLVLQSPRTRARLALRYATFGSLGGFTLVDELRELDPAFADRILTPELRATRTRIERNSRSMLRGTRRGRNRSARVHSDAWAGARLRSTRSKAERVGLALGYQLAFRHLSEHTHGGYGRVASALRLSGRAIGPRTDPEPMPHLRFTLAVIWREYVALLRRIRIFDVSSANGLMEMFGVSTGIDSI